MSKPNLPHPPPPPLVAAFLLNWVGPADALLPPRRRSSVTRVGLRLVQNELGRILYPLTRVKQHAYDDRSVNLPLA